MTCQPGDCNASMPFTQLNLLGTGSWYWSLQMDLAAYNILTSFASYNFSLHACNLQVVIYNLCTSLLNNMCCILWRFTSYRWAVWTSGFGGTVLVFGWDCPGRHEEHPKISSLTLILISTCYCHWWLCRNTVMQHTHVVMPLCLGREPLLYSLCTLIKDVFFCSLRVSTTFTELLYNVMDVAPVHHPFPFILPCYSLPCIICIGRYLMYFRLLLR